MKKSIMALSLLSLISLTACGGITSSSQNSSPAPSTSSSATFTLTQDTLDQLSLGYSLETLVTEDVNGKISYFYTDSFHDAESYTVKVYEASQSTPTKDVNEIFETYSADEQGYLVSERRNLNNEKNFIRVYNPYTSEYSLFDDNYSNFFTFLSIDDFEKSGDAYVLSEEAKAAVSPYIITQLYGNPGFELDSLTIEERNGSIYLVTTPKPFVTSSTTYNYIFESKIVELGSDITIPKRAEPYAEVTDEKFTDMITSLRSKNYKMVQKDYQGNQLAATSTFIVNGNLTYRENEFDGVSYKVAAYKDGENYYEANKEGTEFIKARQITAEEFSALYSSFNISRACFDESDGIYTVKDDVNGDTFAYSIFASLVNEISDFSIEIKDGSYIFTNKNGTNKTVVEFTDIGSADVGYQVSDVKEPSAEVSWKDILDEYSLANLTSVLGEEKLASFPVPEGFNLEGWMDFSEEEGMSMLLYISPDPVADESTLAAYEQKLIAAGYQDMGETDPSAYDAKVYADDSTIVEVALVPAGELGSEFNFPILMIVVAAM